MEQLAHAPALEELGLTGVVSGLKQAIAFIPRLDRLKALRLSAWALMIGPCAGEVTIERGVGVLSSMVKLEFLDLSGVEVPVAAARGIVSRLAVMRCLALSARHKDTELPGWDRVQLRDGVVVFSRIPRGTE